MKSSRELNDFSLDETENDIYVCAFHIGLYKYLPEDIRSNILNIKLIRENFKNRKNAAKAEERKYKELSNILAETY